MFVDENILIILIFAILVDSALGDPDWLWKRLSHPVTLFAKFVLIVDKIRGSSLSSTANKVLGIVVIALLTLVSVLVGIMLIYLLPDTWWGILITSAIASIFLAQKSLCEHVQNVYKALKRNDLEKSREEVSKIVGRDPKQLDESGVARATIESTAENLSDGVVAPVFWCILFGLPGLLAYKAINTADSTIGYKNENYKDFGWATARLDDLMNYIPARITAVLIALSAPVVNGSIKSAMTTAIKDAQKHNSPNAGWPEATMAGVLGIALAGPRIYFTHTENGNWINKTGRKAVTSNDVHKSLLVLIAVCVLQFFVLATVITLSSVLS